jgi:hypothetical protein
MKQLQDKVGHLFTLTRLKVRTVRQISYNTSPAFSSKKAFIWRTCVERGLVFNITCENLWFSVKIVIYLKIKKVLCWSPIRYCYPVVPVLFFTGFDMLIPFQNLQRLPFLSTAVPYILTRKSREPVSLLFRREVNRRCWGAWRSRSTGRPTTGWRSYR